MVCYWLFMFTQGHSEDKWVRPTLEAPHTADGHAENNSDTPTLTRVLTWKRTQTPTPASAPTPAPTPTPTPTPAPTPTPTPTPTLTPTPTNGNSNTDTDTDTTPRPTPRPTTTTTTTCNACPPACTGTHARSQTQPQSHRTTEATQPHGRTATQPHPVTPSHTKPRPDTSSYACTTQPRTHAPTTCTCAHTHTHTHTHMNTSACVPTYTHNVHITGYVTERLLQVFAGLSIGVMFKTRVTADMRTWALGMGVHLLVLQC